MRLRRTRWLTSILLCCATFAAVPAQTRDVPPLSVLLQRLGRVAGLYRDNALRFTCDETITYRGTGGKRTYRLEYIYVYTEDDGLADYRVFRRRAAGRRAAKDKRKRGASSETTVSPADLDDLDLPNYLLRAYSWAFIFEASRRERYEYELEGQEKIAGNRAVRIRFEPLPPFVEGVNEWFGTAWVDLQTYQLLRVEAMLLLDYRKQKRMERLLREASPNVSYTTDEIRRVVTDFGLLENEMRFPSEVTFSASGYVVSGRKRDSRLREVPLYQVRQTYDNYRFFGVRTREEVDGIVFADEAPVP